MVGASSTARFVHPRSSSANGFSDGSYLYLYSVSSTADFSGGHYMGPFFGEESNLIQIYPIASIYGIIYQHLVD